MVEGAFLHRDRLQHYWDFSSYLDVSFDAAADRLVGRGTVEDRADPRLGRYLGAQQLSLCSARPWERASIVVDDTNDPTIVEEVRNASCPG